MEDMKNLIKFCEENGLACWVDGTSEHFPNETIKIGICKSEDEI